MKKLEGMKQYVVNRMAEGWKLRELIRNGRSITWLESPDNKTTYGLITYTGMVVHGNTVTSLLKGGYIERSWTKPAALNTMRLKPRAKALAKFVPSERGL